MVHPDVISVAEMKKNGWDRGQDDEELFEFAMHEKQYCEYKSGEAKRRFNQELEDKMKKKFEQNGASVNLDDLRKMRHPNAEAVTATMSGKTSRSGCRTGQKRGER